LYKNFIWNRQLNIFFLLFPKVMATIKFAFYLEPMKCFCTRCFVRYAPLVYRLTDESSIEIKPAIFTLRANTCKRKHSDITHFYIPTNKISISDLILQLPCYVIKIPKPFIEKMVVVIIGRIYVT
jgi:hypothetical protein